MIARVTSSAQFPIPALPPNPHGGVKENFKVRRWFVKRLKRCIDLK